MSNINITPNVVGGGKGLIAYWIDRPFPDCLNVPTPIFLRTHYDCLSRSINPFGRWSCYLGPGPGKGTIWVSGFGTIASPPHSGYNVINDRRTIKMIAEECCPPDIMMEFLGTEGIPD